MEMIKNVSVEKKVNVYFEGKVTSRNIFLEDGSKQTLGVMMPGTYEFGTEKKEIMEILSGKLKALLPGQSQWQEFKGNASFEVPANSKFKLEIFELTDYCCSYIG
ncbi:MAG: hypothetical protein CMQ54_00460 [Gammaproteobacteria bacterium]|nr:hypothetical protein [Gammaproteobacteria bacterium]|tara:strand:+ start:456 stop:770 length:315 start_codon:yes stop_codon:yes gene_type:complete